MKNAVYNILKARFLVNEDAFRNWRFILFLVLLAIVMIGNNNSYDEKTYRIAVLTNEVKELRSEFVDRRSQLMKLKMESTIAEKMQERHIYPSAVPPVKIRVKQPKKEGFFDKLW
ncbi:MULTISPECIES: FtsL-like putative cell division protein [unclassified Flavobacterium]|uniref:FtsL-like putative cell division protein n=1 Tax=unclassified Flavobacterium TaxID=196869 RepID=UPI001F131097|nr:MULTISPECIES: FtsL-like putative cell division protein [unclassified Flavobacterium]UMY66805.1 S-adenosyl-methyltransferase [Flavobacterium sp. HJ-32-4]HLN96664.1 FtsL-like putative cell division protein [Flavobacterium sp.]